jgi:hypothetical protein
MFPPDIVQLTFGLGNPISPRWLAIQGLSGQATMEDIEMFARKGVFSSISRAGAVAGVVAAALTAMPPAMAFAGSAPKGVTATTGTSGATDFSARRYYRGGGGGAAAAAAFAGIVGTGLAIAATQNRYDYYDGGYGYAPPAYYGGGPVYYGGGPYYGGYGGYGSNPNYHPGGYNNPSAW